MAYYGYESDVVCLVLASPFCGLLVLGLEGGLSLALLLWPFIGILDPPTFMAGFLEFISSWRASVVEVLAAVGLSLLATSGGTSCPVSSLLLLEML